MVRKITAGAKIRNSGSIVVAQENLSPDLLITTQNDRSFFALKLYGSLEGLHEHVQQGVFFNAGKSRRGLNLTGLLLVELRDYYVGRGGLKAPEFRDL